MWDQPLEEVQEVRMFLEPTIPTLNVLNQPIHPPKVIIMVNITITIIMVIITQVMHIIRINKAEAKVKRPVGHLRERWDPFLHILLPVDRSNISWQSNCEGSF